MLCVWGEINWFQLCKLHEGSWRGVKREISLVHFYTYVLRRSPSVLVSSFSFRSNTHLLTFSRRSFFAQECRKRQLELKLVCCTSARVCSIGKWHLVFRHIFVIMFRWKFHQASAAEAKLGQNFATTEQAVSYGGVAPCDVTSARARAVPERCQVRRQHLSLFFFSFKRGRKIGRNEPWAQSW